MKILVISAAYPPMMAPEGDHAYHLCQRLADRGCIVDVLTTEGSAASENGRLTIRPVMREWSWSEVPRLVRHVTRSSPDAVLLMYVDWVYKNHPMITFAPTFIRKLLPNATIVTQVEDRHGILPDKCPIVTRVIRKAVAIWAGLSRVNYSFGTLFQGSDRIIVLSDVDRAELTSLDPSVTDKTVLIPCPPILHVRPENNGEARREGRQALGVGPEEFLFAYFGYVYHGKGIETLLGAFAQVLARRPECRLAMIGGEIERTMASDRPSYAEEMRDLVRKLGIEDKVRWSGEYAWDSDIGSMYLRAADAGVFPLDAGVFLYNSGFAAAAVHGLPLVATQGWLREPALVHGENVLLCPSKSVEALRDAMMTLLDEPELRDRLRVGVARLATDCFSWQSAIDRTIATLAGNAEVRDLAKPCETTSV